MSQSNNLPIYKDTFTMLGMVINRVKDYPRFYRYTIGEKMVNINLDMLSLIYRANSSYNKLPIITQLDDRYRMLVMLFRLSIEQRMIPQNNYANMQKVV
ncbi:four helix bundle protein [Prevotella sp.]|uniref:four helix bundle protein n=1 Tax=Prevotella sp. TaxID=59823 RepID=UPI002649495A|nr:four helix bundle protein [Prevotella sp.]MDN5554785.1 four helix bundle protein [Prevotella sp.]